MSNQSNTQTIAKIQLLQRLKTNLQRKVSETEEVLEHLDLERESAENIICHIIKQISGKDRSQSHEIHKLKAKQQAYENEIVIKNKLIDQEWAEINRLYQEYQKVQLQLRIIQIQWRESLQSNE